MSENKKFFKLFKFYNDFYFSRSDLVKVGSEQTSGHTSGDELETTTSSDIEIISRYRYTKFFFIQVIIRTIIF